MAFSVWVDGVEYPILKTSLSIEKRIEERSTASFTVVDKLGTEDFVRGMPVEIFDSVPALIFSGFIDTPGRGKPWVGVGLLHDIVCMDNHYLADKRLVVKAYTTPGQTLADIVNDILADYLNAEGVIIGEIQTGPTISEAIFNYVKVSNCFDALKELSGFTWFIDELKALYFVDRNTYSAPWNLDGVTHRAIKKSVHLSTGNPYYRNIQYVRGGKGITSSDIEEHFTGDAIITSFTVGFPIAQVPDVWVNAVSQVVGIKGIDSGPPYTCYWNKGDATITFDTAPGAGLDVEVLYYGQYPLISMAISGSGITDRQSIEGSSGMVEEITIEVEHESAESINQSAQGKVTQYCQNAEKFIYKTNESGLAPGQLQQITYAPFGFTSHDMLIESVSITTNGEDIRYDISCITGPTMGSWAKFFANILTRQDKTIKIGDSLLLVLLQEQERLELTEVVSLDKDDFTTGESNRWLNTPPIDAGSLQNVQHERLKMTEVGSESHHATENYLWDFFNWDFATYA